MKMINSKNLSILCFILASVAVMLAARNCARTDGASIRSLPFSIGDTRGVLELGTGPEWAATIKEPNQYGTALRVCSLRSGNRVIDIMVDVAGGDYVSYATSLTIGQPKETWRPITYGPEYHIMYSGSGSFAISEPIILGSESFQIILSTSFDIAPSTLNISSLGIMPSP